MVTANDQACSSRETWPYRTRCRCMLVGLHRLPSSATPSGTLPQINKQALLEERDDLEACPGFLQNVNDSVIVLNLHDTKVSSDVCTDVLKSEFRAESLCDDQVDGVIKNLDGHFIAVDVVLVLDGFDVSLSRILMME